MRTIAYALCAGIAFGAAAANEKSVLATVTSLEGETAHTAAQAQAEDLLIVKDVPWQRVDGNAEPPGQRYVQPEAATLSCTLVFEGTADISPQIQTLLRMAQKDSSLVRPPKVRFTTAAISFSGVIDQVAVHYTQYLADGAPVKARVELHLKEAGALQATAP